MTRLPIALLAFALLAGCADGPREIRLGEEECAHCRMLVSEAAFAAQLRTAQGRTLMFDSVECLAEYAAGPDADGARMWVTDFRAPGSWLPAEEAHYLQSPGLRSPMGLNLSAYASQTEAEVQAAEHGGSVLDWSSVLRYVGEARADNRPRHAH
jgi:copper chaperone NosL